jgi:hypothetical protein
VRAVTGVRAMVRAKTKNCSSEHFAQISEPETKQQIANIFD